MAVDGDFGGQVGLQFRVLLDAKEGQALNFLACLINHFQFLHVISGVCR